MQNTRISIVCWTRIVILSLAWWIILLFDDTSCMSDEIVKPYRHMFIKIPHLVKYNTLTYLWVYMGIYLHSNQTFNHSICYMCFVSSTEPVYELMMHSSFVPLTEANTLRQTWIVCYRTPPFDHRSYVYV
jgi:hypothetical protein